MDPYYLIKQEVTSTTNSLRTELSNRNDMINDPRGNNVDIFQSCGTKMNDDIISVRNFLNDIRESITQVRKSPDRFKISEAELAARESFVQQTELELNQIETEMQAQSVNQRMQFRSAAYQPAPPPKFSNFEPDQFQLQAHQEEQIDQIAETVKMEMQLGIEIRNEIEDQQKMLLDIDEGIENTKDAMQQVTNQIKKLIDEEGKMPTMTVVILSIVLIFLIFFLI